MTTGIKGYYPEMGEAKPATQIEASMSHYGKHWFVSTPLELKGRGVVFVDKYTPENTRPGSHRLGWNRYKVTDKAFDKIKAEHAVAVEFLL